jgi:serine/threonine protein kinase
MKVLLDILERNSRPRKPSSAKDVSVSRSGASLTIASSISSGYASACAPSSSSSRDHDYLIESKERARTIVEITQKTLLGLLENENEFEHERNFTSNDKNHKNLQYLSHDDLLIGETLAMGGFGCIRQVHAATLSSSNKFVMKTLIPMSRAASDAKLVSAAHQLAKERYFLSHLSHPNIISMYAMSKGGLSVIQETRRLDSYFIVEEYMPMLLTDQIQIWHQKRNRQRRPRWPSTKKMNPQVFLEQITCAVEIASALNFLHQQRIIFRDVKSANVGISAQRQAKLFDFGLAVQLPKDADLDALQPSLGGSRVGTLRMMATEVLRKQPYNVKADVFSFALLLWEMIILDQRPPEGGCGVYGSRPTLPSHWPSTLTRILERAWADDFQNERPHMSEVLLFLQDLQRQLLSEYAAREQKSRK